MLAGSEQDQNFLTRIAPMNADRAKRRHSSDMGHGRSFAVPDSDPTLALIRVDPR
jgi:hypothetical protein